MKTNRKSVLVTLLLTLVMLLSSITVFGADLNTVVVNVPSSDSQALGQAFSGYGGKDSEKLQPKAGSDWTAQTLVSVNGTKITFNQGAFEQATDKSRKKAVEAFVDRLSKSEVSDQTQQNIFESMSNSDRQIQAMMIPLIFDSTSADLYTAMKWVTPLLGILRVVLGVGAIILVVLILGSTLMDCIYIGIPMARGNKDGGNSNDKPFGVSYDAISVVKEVESSLDGNSKYKNGYIIYLRRRAITYFVLGLCLLYLIVGELGGLMAWLMSLGSGIVS